MTFLIDSSMCSWAQSIFFPMLLYPKSLKRFQGDNPHLHFKCLLCSWINVSVFLQTGRWNVIYFNAFNLFMLNNNKLYSLCTAHKNLPGHHNGSASVHWCKTKHCAYCCKAAGLCPIHVHQFYLLSCANESISSSKTLTKRIHMLFSQFKSSTDNPREKCS